MRLSFVVPAYNEVAYLPACLESILSQISNLPTDSCEIIVVKNASTDRTREVALRYPGITVVDGPRKGLSFFNRPYTNSYIDIREAIVPGPQPEA